MNDKQKDDYEKFKKEWDRLFSMFEKELKNKPVNTVASDYITPWDCLEFEDKVDRLRLCLKSRIQKENNLQYQIDGLKHSLALVNRMLIDVVNRYEINVK